MKNAIILLADGFEEMEAVLPIDLLRRSGMNVVTVSMNDSHLVRGSRNIVLEANLLANDITDEYINTNTIDVVYCPGGMDGSKNLSKHPLTENLIHKTLEKGGLVCSICAASIIVLGPLGLLDGKKFTCYPGMEKQTQYAPNADLSQHSNDLVVQDGSIITSQGPGTAALLAFKIIEVLLGKEKSEKVRTESLFTA